jgi:hypothetical protein
VALRQIVDLIVKPDAPKSYESSMLALLDRMAANQSYAEFSEFRRLVPYLRGRLYLSKLDMETACQQFKESLPLYNDVGAGLMMVAETASYRAYDCATVLLDESEQIMRRQSDNSLRRSREMYEKEIHHLRGLIKEDSAAWEKERLRIGKKPPGSPS